MWTKKKEKRITKKSELIEATISDLGEILYKISLFSRENKKTLFMH